MYQAMNSIICTPSSEMIFCFFLNKKISIEVIVDSHAFVRNNTGRSQIPFMHFTPGLKVLHNYSKYCNQDPHMDTIHWCYSDFWSLTCTRECVCAYVCLSVYGVRSPPQDTERIPTRIPGAAVLWSQAPPSSPLHSPATPLTCPHSVVPSVQDAV